MISRPEYPAARWYVASPRSTVMAALLDNGQFPGIERSTNLRDLVDPTRFAVPWWYRTTFVARGSARTTLRLDGVIHKADLFVNGTQVATTGEIAGANSVCAFEVTELVRAGVNSLALRVHPGSPLEELSISWVDWNQWPPDNNLGIWRDVVIERTGDVRLGPPAVTADLPLPELAPAELRVSVEVANLSGAAVTAELRGIVSGHGADARFGRTLDLEPRSRQVVRFSPTDSPDLRLVNPALWWPIGEGSPDLYDLQVAVSVDGMVSDQRETTFGVRSLASHIEPGGGRRFVLNGRPIQIVGAGWCPDLFLRYDPGRIAAELSYVADLGLNTVRLEGKLENAEFFAMTDAAGILVLPGWECCSKWEAEKGPQGAPWVEHDYVVAGRSMESEAVLLRNHPSVIGFMIGSDFAPPPRTAAIYVDALRRSGWSTPVISSATTEGTEAAGPSGMKMTGPYAWVPPVYWYATDPEHGGAVGFNSETAAGGNIPRLTSLKRMLSPDELESLWGEPDAKQFHAGPPSEFDNLAIFHRALAGRYGRITSLDDFVRKAQLASYEAARAQFEAYLSRNFADEPATGVIYWMLNSAWPSLNWQLYDWYLDPGGAYFGAKKACEPVHVFYAYDRASIAVLNRRRERVGPFELTASVVDLAGATISSQRQEITEVGPLSTVTFEGMAPPENADPTYFLALRLLDRGGTAVSRNVYWLSTVPDRVEWGQRTWQYTPTSQFADLSGLQRIAVSELDAQIERSEERGGEANVRLRLRNVSPERTPAVGVHAAIARDASDGERPLPVYWSENDVTLFAGDELTLDATFPVVRGAAVEVDGFNVPVPIRISR